MPVMSKRSSAGTKLPIPQAVSLLAFGESLDQEALARRLGCYRSPELEGPPHLAEEAEKIQLAMRSLCQQAERGAITIIGRPGQSTRDDRYPERYGDYAAIPREVFCGSPELCIGWPPFPIIQSGDNIYCARWFFPMVKDHDIIAIRRELFESSPSGEPIASVFRRASAKDISLFTRDYVGTETKAGRVVTQLGLVKAARCAGLDASRKQLRLELSQHARPKRGAPKKSSRQFAAK